MEKTELTLVEKQQAVDWLIENGLISWRQGPRLMHGDRVNIRGVQMGWEEVANQYRHQWEGDR